MGRLSDTDPLKTLRPGTKRRAFCDSVAGKVKAGTNVVNNKQPATNGGDSGIYVSDVACNTKLLQPPAFFCSNKGRLLAPGFSVGWESGEGGGAPR